MPLLSKIFKALRQAASFSLPLAAFHPIHSHTLLARDRFDIVGVSRSKLDIRSMMAILKLSPHTRMTSYCQNKAEVSSVGNCQMSHGNPFDLVTLAWSLPGMDGIKTAGRIRGNPRLIRQPGILMITAQSRVKDMFHSASREWRTNPIHAPGQTPEYTPGHTPPHEHPDAQACPPRCLKPDIHPAPPKDAFLFKPVQMDVLQDTVRYVLGVG